MEAICIHLVEKFPTAKRGPGQKYTSRWRLILTEYSNIRQRLLNSGALLEGVNLALFTINETTLVSTAVGK